jgi:hypothetical protein
MRHLSILAAVLTVSAPAVACLNYTESTNHEREFRSQYRDTQYAPPQPATASASRDYVLGGSGMLMALAGAAVLYRQRGQA